VTGNKGISYQSLTPPFSTLKAI